MARPELGGPGLAMAAPSLCLGTGFTLSVPTLFKYLLGPEGLSLAPLSCNQAHSSLPCSLPSFPPFPWLMFNCPFRSQLKCPFLQATFPDSHVCLLTESQSPRAATMVPPPSPGPSAGLGLSKSQRWVCVLEAKGIFKTNEASPPFIYMRKLRPREVALCSQGTREGGAGVTGAHTAPPGGGSECPALPLQSLPLGATCFVWPPSPVNNGIKSKLLPTGVTDF